MGKGSGAGPASIDLAAELERRERELAVLGAITSVTGTVVDPADALLTVCEHLRAVLPDGPMLAALLGIDDITVAPLAPRGPSLRLRLPLFDDSPLGTALAERRLTRGSFSAGLHPPLFSGETAAAEWLVAPLRAGDQVFGALLAGSVDEDALDERHAQLLDQVALHVAVALEHAQLHDDMRRHVQQIETLREVVESISSELDQDRLLQRIVSAAVELLHAYGGAVGLVQPDGAAVHLKAVVNIPEELGTAIPAGVGVMGLALSTRGPVVAHDYAELPAPIPLEALFHLAPWIAVPIFWQGTVTGVFGICAADPSRRFTNADVEMLTLFAKHVAVAFENARLYQQSRELAVTEERNRLAREIHDTLAQSLTGMVLQIQVIDELLSAEQTQARAELSALQRLARTTLDEARRSVWGLRPPVLEEASLAEALDRQLREASAAVGFVARFATSGRPRPLTPAIEAGVYRITQEALTNIRRHAEARSVVVLLRFEAGELSLVVQDDGRGIDPARVSGSDGGFGLTSMQERARLMGGTMTLESEPGHGTRVEVRVPYLASALDGGTSRESGGQRGPDNWPIRVLVVDDHDVARHGIVRMLETNSDIVVVAEAADGQEGLARARQLKPDVMLVDLNMPGMNGIELIEALSREEPGVRPIILTTYARDDLIFDGIRAGARGFLLKDISAEDLARAVRTVNEGQSLLQPVVATRLVEQLGRLARREPSRDLLTPRELDVLRLLVGGSRNKEISAQLKISHGTVRFHVGNIFQKLNVSSRTEAVRLAIREGLVD